MFDVVAELANGPQAVEQPEDSVPADLDGPPDELSNGQPVDPGVDQEATQAEADGMPRTSASVSGQLLIFFRQC